MKWPRPTRGDVAIAVAVVLLVWALAAPALRARAFRATVEAAASDVELVVRAAGAIRASSGRWPAASEAGTVPAELTGAVPFEAGFVRDGYSLEWAPAEVVDYVEVEAPPPSDPVPGDAPALSVAVELRPAPRSVGVLRLRSADPRLLAELLRRFGPERSYVRDSTWTLLVENGDTP